MLLSLLYGQRGELLAAAPACDQEPLGQRYWFEIYEGEIDVRQVSETSVVEIRDEKLVERLLDMGFVDGEEAAEFVDEYLAIPPVADAPVLVQATEQ